MHVSVKRPATYTEENSIELFDGLRAGFIQLHLNGPATDSEFTKKYGKQIKQMGGYYDDCRERCKPRFTTIPLTAEGRKLADELLAANPYNSVIFEELHGWPRHLLPNTPGVVLGRKAGKAYPTLTSVEDAAKIARRSLEAAKKRNLEQAGPEAHTPFPGFQIDVWTATISPVTVWKRTHGLVTERSSYGSDGSLFLEFDAAKAALAEKIAERLRSAQTELTKWQGLAEQANRVPVPA